MIERKQISLRLKELRKNKKYSQNQVAQNLFISQAAYSLIENAQNGIVAEHLIKLSSLYGVTTDFILKGDKNVIRVGPKNGFVPFVKATAHAGFVKNHKNGIAEEDYEWFKIPGYDHALDYKLFEVEGESMIPTIHPSEIVICQPQKKLNNLLDGTVVLIITSNSIIIKRFKVDKDLDYCLLESDNPNDQSQHRLKKSDIKEVMVVTGKISNAVVTSQFISTGKILAMEEAIQMLKNELEEMSIKLKAIQKN